jgi:polyisoprenoid-binding protein YceI
MRRALVFALAPWLVLAAESAAAERWRVEDDRSSLSFSFVINGVETKGAFPSFEGTGRFDPAAPQDSSLELTVAVDAVDLGNPIADHFARSFDWFWAEEHPAGTFRLDRVEPAGDGLWTAFGTLRLRGVTREVETPVELELGETTARAWGEAVFDRTAFGIGQGPSAALVEVSEEIRVRFDLTAEAAPGR